MSDKKFATLSSLSKRQSRSRSKSRHSSNDSNDGDRQSLYVGGSEHSGQQVLGSPSPNEDFISRIFNGARAHGTAITEEEFQNLGKNRAFASGSVGYRLGDSSGQSIESVPNTKEANSESKKENVTLKIWRDGFTLNNGPFRDLSDRENVQFLESIMQGRMPMELVRMYPGRVIDMRMERNPGLYEPPNVTKHINAFGGQGNRLGGIVPCDNIEVENENFDQESSTDSPKDAADDDVKLAQDEVKINEEEPVTQIQFRLPNGKKIIGRFNYTHTIQDLRSFIVSAIPKLAFNPFDLMTVFPNRIMKEETETLQDMSILNSVIIVKPN